MIPLPRAAIDNIFNPRRPVNLGVRPAANRLLVDATGKFQYIGSDGTLHVLLTSHWLEPRKHFPVWIQTETIPVEPLWEVLPGPCSQLDVMLALYKIAFPQWDNIAAVDGWPKVSHRTWEYICDLFREFDRRMAPGVFAGGAWMNQGFSTLGSENMPDWKIDTSGCKITYTDVAKAS